MFGRRRMRYVCECRHPCGHHEITDNKGYFGKCHGTKTTQVYDKDDHCHVTGPSVECPCLHYVGPPPPDGWTKVGIGGLE